MLVKITCHHTFMFFFILSFLIAIPSILTECFCRYLSTNVAMEKSVGKIHHNLLTEKFRR